MATVFRGPLVTKYQRSAVQQPDYQDSPNIGLLAGKDARLLPTDIANPRGPLYPIALRTWTQNTPLLLIGKDLMFGAAGQVQEYDWPNPLRPSRRIPDDGPNLLGTTLVATVVASPFASQDWPNPQRKASEQVDVPPYIVSQLLAPFQQSDWPQPAKVRAVRFDDAPNLLSATLFVTPSPPFVPGDFPNPLTRKQLFVLLETNLANTLLQTVPDVVIGVVADEPRGGGWLHLGHRRTKEEIRAERERLGILPKPEIVVQALKQPDPVEALEDGLELQAVAYKAAYRRALLEELRIRRQRDDEAIALVLLLH